jgi:Xaa-Pro dipeptidase
MATSPRLEKLYALLRQNQLDAAAFIPGPNLVYLAGANHGLMERPLILIAALGREPVVIIPKIEAELFRGGGLAAQLFEWTDAEGYQGAFQSALQTAQLMGKRLGIEGIKMRYFEAEALRQHAPGMTLVQADDPLSYLRIHKDAEEIAALRKAIQISEAALEQTLLEVKIGMTEVEVANRLVEHMQALGAEGLAFDPIVLAGDNSARPHGHPRADYAIQKGDALLFDFGAKYSDFSADITRTFFVGADPSPKARQLYEAVHAANQAARAHAKIGVTAASVDEAARRVLTEHGYEAMIAHRTGHGLGMDIHEHPNIVLTNPQVLEQGMVFTIEPGLYDPSLLGVRIEDNMVITPEGAESLTTFPRELTILPG